MASKQVGESAGKAAAKILATPLPIYPQTFPIHTIGHPKNENSCCISHTFFTFDTASHLEILC